MAIATKEGNVGQHRQIDPVGKAILRCSIRVATEVATAFSCKRDIRHCADNCDDGRYRRNQLVLAIASAQKIGNRGDAFGFWTGG